MKLFNRKHKLVEVVLTPEKVEKFKAEGVVLSSGTKVYHVLMLKSNVKGLRHRRSKKK